MKNVTITMPDQTLAQVRIEAARTGRSVSRFLCDLATERFQNRENDPGAAMRAFLAGPSYELTDENGNAPSRDRMYDRSRSR